MGRHGENIRKRKDGRWEARYLSYDEKKGKKVYRSVYGNSYEEVKTKRVAATGNSGNFSAQDRKTEAGHQSPSDILFETSAREWLSKVKSELKPSTYEKYGFIYHVYLEIPLGKMALDKISEIIVKEALSGRELSGSLRKSIYCVMNRILNYASEQYMVMLPDIKMPSLKERKREIEVFTMSDQARIFSAVYHKMDFFKLAVLLCLFTGLRLGEICALKWTDINFEEKTLFVRRTVQRLYKRECDMKTALIETEPKSSKSKREIPLPESIVSLLSHFKNDSEYIFGGNKPLEPRTMQNHYKKILEEAGISYRNFHALRHTYATNCIEGGTDVKSLSEMLGHADVQITLNCYVHPSMDTKRRHVDGLSDFYAGIHGQIHGNAEARKP